MSGHISSPSAPKSRLHPRNLTGKLRRTTKDPLRLGEFSDFYTAEHDLQDLPKILAVKAFRGSHSRDQQYFDEFTSTLEKFLDRWVNFAHDNIAECYGYALDCGPLPALIMKYYSKGNITQYITTENPSFGDRIQLVLDVARGLEYLHTQQQPVVHGDLRAANVFVNDKKRAVIADFELRKIIDYRNFTSYKPAGPARWMAPELSADDEDDKDDEDDEDKPHCTLATDIFALAMTIFEIFTGDVPFASKKQEMPILRIIYEGGRPEMPKEISDCLWLKDLLEQCWHQDPKQRPTVSKVVDTLTKNIPRSSWWSYVFSYIPGAGLVRKLLS